MLQVLEQCQDRRCKILEIFPRFKMNPIHFYSFTNSLFLCQGAGVWIPDPDAVWVSAQLLRDYSPREKHLLLQLSNGKVRHAVPLYYNKKYQCKCSSIMLNSTVLSLSQQQLLTSFSIGRRFSIQWRPPLISHHSGTLTSWRGKMI